MCTWARSHTERRMNNLQVPRGSKSFSLNILPVSSFRSRFWRNFLGKVMIPIDPGGGGIPSTQRAQGSAAPTPPTDSRWRAEPSLREVMALWLVTCLVFVTSVAMLRNYFELADNSGDS